MKFVFWCSSEQTQFRLAELESLAALFSIPLEWVHRSDQTPWVVLELETEEQARLLLSRSVAVKFCCQLWAEGASLEEFHENLKTFPFLDHSELFGEQVSYKVEVESYMKKISIKEKIKKIETVDYLPVRGPVSLTDPTVTFNYMEFFSLDHNNLPEQPTLVMFGRKVGDGQRERITRLSIKRRKFIGNTTMDPQLALIMANLGKVALGSLVLDPFVGTGSLLLAAADFGGAVLGADIDWLTLHAKTRPSRVNQKVRALDESMLANFQQYGLSSRYLGVVTGDASLPPWRQDRPWLDCIVTDPPYGVRECTTRVGTENDYSGRTMSLNEQYKENHLPEKVSYSLHSLLSDLLNFSARNLVPGGRLVFWLPVIRQEYTPELAPSHPCLELMCDCEQVLSSNISRRLLVLQRRGGVMFREGEVVVSDRLTSFQEQWYLPIGKHIPKKERKERIKEFGHLNLSEDEISKITSG